MMAQWILIVFILEFILLILAASWDSNTGMALYGLGGAILNIGVLIMNQIN